MFGHRNEIDASTPKIARLSRDETDRKTEVFEETPFPVYLLILQLQRRLTMIGLKENAIIEFN